MYFNISTQTQKKHGTTSGNCINILDFNRNKKSKPNFSNLAKKNHHEASLVQDIFSNQKEVFIHRLFVISFQK